MTYLEPDRKGRIAVEDVETLAAAFRTASDYDHKRADAGLEEELQALHDGAELDGWLNAVSDAAVIEVSDGGWRFAHDKLREGLLAAGDRFRKLVSLAGRSAWLAV